jgi:hypothetical protein
MSAMETEQQSGRWAVVKAVFWSFLGIRKRSAYQRDAVTLKPHQVIIAGIIGAVLFVLTIVTVVRLVISQYSQ